MKAHGDGINDTPQPAVKKNDVEIKAVIVRRRSMGKNLAFLHIKVIEVLKGDEAILRSESDEDTIQVVFRRQSDAWDSSMDETFPIKNSVLPYGAIIELHLHNIRHDSSRIEIANNFSNSPNFEVRKWAMLVDPRIEAEDHAKTKVIHTYEGRLGDNKYEEGLSCSKYLTSRMNDYLKYNENKDYVHKPKQSKETRMNRASQVDSSESHGNKKHKALRAKIFASFLIDQFGREFFQKGQVLDVAGGKGALSLELTLQSQTLCTIIDPMIRGHKDYFAYSRRDIKRIQRADGPVPNHIAKCFVLNDECLELANASNCIVGLHPDECTEDILDAAIKLDKPAAIVPCCVFASASPFRMLKDGTAVWSYEQFLVYLMEKDDTRIQRFSLPFEGKNQALVFFP